MNKRQCVSVGAILLASLTISWQGIAGETVTIKCGPGVDGDRRVNGTLIAADDDSVTVALDDPEGTERTLLHRDIAKARTTFAWDAAGSATRKASRS